MNVDMIIILLLLTKLLCADARLPAGLQAATDRIITAPYRFRYTKDMLLQGGTHVDESVQKTTYLWRLLPQRIGMAWEKAATFYGWRKDDTSMADLVRRQPRQLVELKNFYDSDNSAARNYKYQQLLKFKSRNRNYQVIYAVINADVPVDTWVKNGRIRYTSKFHTLRLLFGHNYREVIRAMQSSIEKYLRSTGLKDIICEEPRRRPQLPVAATTTPIPTNSSMTTPEPDQPSDAVVAAHPFDTPPITPDSCGRTCQLHAVPVALPGVLRADEGATVHYRTTASEEHYTLKNALRVIGERLRKEHLEAHYKAIVVPKGITMLYKNKTTKELDALDKSLRAIVLERRKERAEKRFRFAISRKNEVYDRFPR
jgi:hypothetical protein